VADKLVPGRWRGKDFFTEAPVAILKKKAGMRDAFGRSFFIRNVCLSVYLLSFQKAGL